MGWYVAVDFGTNKAAAEKTAAKAAAPPAEKAVALLEQLDDRAAVGAKGAAATPAAKAVAKPGDPLIEAGQKAVADKETAAKTAEKKAADEKAANEKAKAVTQKNLDMLRTGVQGMTVEAHAAHARAKLAAAEKANATNTTNATGNATGANATTAPGDVEREEARSRKAFHLADENASGYLDRKMAVPALEAML